MVFRPHPVCFLDGGGVFFRPHSVIILSAFLPGTGFFRTHSVIIFRRFRLCSGRRIGLACFVFVFSSDLVLVFAVIFVGVVAVWLKG